MNSTRKTNHNVISHDRRVRARVISLAVFVVVDVVIIRTNGHRSRNAVDSMEQCFPNRGPQVYTRGGSANSSVNIVISNVTNT